MPRSGDSYGGLTKPSRPLNKDALSMLPRTRAVSTAHEALFPIQGKMPEEMLGGVALLFATLCTRCGVDPEDMHRMGMKLLRDPDQEGGDRGNNGLLQALKDFAGIRIMGEKNVSIM